MLSISRKKIGAVSYYTSAVRSGEVPSIYWDGASNQIDAPGEWFVSPAHGRPRELFGCRDGEPITNAAFLALCSGHHPGTGEPLVQGATRPNRTSVIDITLTAPKSVSIVWALVPEAVRRQIEDAQREAVRETLEYASQFVYTRRGRGSVAYERAQLIASTHRHGTSRDGDPLLHVHAVLQNLCQRADGTTGAIELGLLYPRLGQIASHYHADLAARLANIGCTIVHEPGSGLFEIAGVPDSVQQAFSKRRAEIERRVRERLVAERETDLARALGIERGDLSHAAREHVAAAVERDLSEGVERYRALHDTIAETSRRSKTRDERSAWQVFRDWALEAFRAGFRRVGRPAPPEVPTEAEATAIQAEVSALATEALGDGRSTRRPLTPEEIDEICRVVPEVLTESDISYTEPRVYAAVTQQCLGRATPEEIQAIVDRICAEAVLLQEPPRAPTAVREIVDRYPGSFAPHEVDPRLRVYTTRTMARIELELTEIARTRRAEHVCSESEIEAAVARVQARSGLRLSDEQLAAVQHLAGTDAAVAVLEGAAGAGKSTLLEAVVEVYQQRGYNVHGTALGWRQAEGLREIARLTEAPAIAALLSQIERGTRKLDARSLVIVDEAALVGHRQMRRLIEAVVEQAGGKLLVVGHTAQLNSIEAGGAMRALTDTLGAAHVDTVVRQRRAEHRRASELLVSRDGDRQTNVREALDVYRSAGDIRFATGAESTDRQLVADWLAWRREHPGQRALLLAGDRASVRRLNTLARAALREAGEIGGEAVRIRAHDSAGERDLLEFAAGDRIQFRRRIGRGEGAVYNRTQGEILAVAPSATAGEYQITVRLDDGREVQIDTGDEACRTADGRVAISHAYATTVYAAQGATAETTFARWSAAQDNRLTYVQLTRHRAECRVYLDREEVQEAINARSDEYRSLIEHHRLGLTDDELFEQMVTQASRVRDKATLADYDRGRELLAEIRQERLSAAAAVERLQAQSQAACRVYRGAGESAPVVIARTPAEVLRARAAAVRERRPLPTVVLAPQGEASLAAAGGDVQALLRRARVAA